MKKDTPAANYCKELLEQFPNAPTLTLAKKAYSEHPELWRDQEAARSMLRWYRGAMGKASRKAAKQQREFTPEMWNPFGFPASDEAEYLPFILPEDCRQILWLSDVHVPYHSVEALTAACRLGIEHGCDTIFLGGDFMDFYGLSSYEKDPRKRSFSGELELGRQILGRLRDLFPDQRIYFLLGNHEERLERYLRVKAPELLDCSEFRLDQLLRFQDLDIELIDGKRMVHAGDLVLLHGHEFGRGSGGVFPARSLMLKAKVQAICGHWHRPSTHTEKDVKGTTMRTWTTGCLCELHPEYLPLNNWSHGCATISIQDGVATVLNHRIQDGLVG